MSDLVELQDDLVTVLLHALIGRALQRHLHTIVACQCPSRQPVGDILLVRGMNVLASPTSMITASPVLGSLMVMVCALRSSAHELSLGSGVSARKSASWTQ